MVQKKSLGDVFSVYVCLPILSRVRCSFHKVAPIILIYNYYTKFW